MAVISADALERALSQGRRGGVFFLFGEEDYLRRDAERRLVEAHLDPGTRDFNFDQLGGGELDAEAFASALATPPMMSEWRVVLVRDAQALAGSARLRSTVEEILAAPPPGLALVLSAVIPSGSKAKFYDVLRKQAVAVEFPPLGSGDLPGWLMEWAAARHLELEPEAARTLVAAIGTDLGVLLQEMAKLRELAGAEARIDRDLVESAVGAIRRQDRWEWFDWVGAGRFADARRALPVLLDSGESGVGLVIGLGSQLLRLGIGATGGEAALSDALPRHQRWLAKRLMGQARRWSPSALEGALEDLLRADRLLKSSSLDERQIVEELLYRLEARGREAAA